MLNRMVLYALSWCLIIHVTSGQQSSANEKYKAIKVDQQIMIGGLFPVHDWDQPPNGPGKCGHIHREKGMQRMEAMLYAIDRINNRTDILRNVNLGVHILDTCSKDTYAFKQAFDFIQLVMSGSSIAAELYTCSNGDMPKPLFSGRYNEPTPVAAVIGAANSGVSVQVANLLGQFKIPQISYSSTGTRLSDRMRYEYFSRVVPPDNLQANAMVDVVAALNWTYVHAIADRGDYGELGVKNFIDIAQKRGIWIDGHVHIVEAKWANEDYESCLRLMKSTKKARGVIMFVNEGGVKRILEALEKLTEEDPTYIGYFMMIASDSWGTKTAATQDVENMAIGSITVAPKQEPDQGFDRYFKSLSPRSHGARDVWFPEFWGKLGCTSRHVDLEHCMDDVGYHYKQESYVSYVISAIDVLANALDRYLQHSCPFNNSFDIKKCDLKFKGQQLQSYYRNVSFKAGENPMIDHNGDGIGEYIIYQFTFLQEYKPVGHWMDGTLLEFNVTSIQEGLNGTAIPNSTCSLPCPSGFYKQIPENNDVCWTCIECYSTVNYKSIQPNETTCKRCENHTLPNVFRNECIAMVPESIEWSSPWALAPAVFSTLGICATIVVIYTFIRYNKTPVIMASGRELCYFMIVGILCTYLMTFVLVAPPTVFTCATVRIGLGGSLAFIYSAILTKTSRLARVFRTQIKSTKPPRFISPMSQVGICGGLVAVQVLGTIVWMIWAPPTTTIVYNEMDTEAVRSCAATTTTLLISLSYNIVLICMCTFYAFKTRKIPENFNETKYIGFTMYATCIIWMAFVPIYFATADQFRIQITSFSACISLSGTVALGCFFAPKVYIVLFQPEKNVRNKGAVRALFSQQMAVLRTMTDAKDFTGAGSMPGFMMSGASAIQMAVHVHREDEEGQGQTANAEMTKESTNKVSSDQSAQPLLANHNQSHHNHTQSANIISSASMTSKHPNTDAPSDQSIAAKPSSVSVNAHVMSNMPSTDIQANINTVNLINNNNSSTPNNNNNCSIQDHINQNADDCINNNQKDDDGVKRTILNNTNGKYVGKDNNACDDGHCSTNKNNNNNINNNNNNRKNSKTGSKRSSVKSVTTITSNTMTRPNSMHITENGCKSHRSSLHSRRSQHSMGGDSLPTVDCANLEDRLNYSREDVQFMMDRQSTSEMPVESAVNGDVAVNTTGTIQHHHHHPTFVYANDNISASTLRMRKSQSMPSGVQAKRVKRAANNQKDGRGGKRSDGTWTVTESRATVELILQELVTNKEETFV